MSDEHISAVNILNEGLRRDGYIPVNAVLVVTALDPDTGKELLFHAAIIFDDEVAAGREDQSPADHPPLSAASLAHCDALAALRTRRAATRPREGELWLS